MDKTALKQSYNNHARYRDKSQMEPWKYQEREQFLNLIKDNGFSKILEIGAGPGRDSLYFQRSGLDVTCIDLSDEMVRLCKDKGLNAHCMDFYELDFPTHHFDAVYALNCLLHVPKVQLDVVLDQIIRVLRPGGIFFCGVYGGQDTEGIWEKDAYEPKRFFSMYEDDVLLERMNQRFTVEDFHTVSMGEGAPHFQSFMLRTNQ